MWAAIPAQTLDACLPGRRRLAKAMPRVSRAMPSCLNASITRLGITRPSTAQRAVGNCQIGGATTARHRHPARQPTSLTYSLAGALREFRLRYLADKLCECGGTRHVHCQECGVAAPRHGKQGTTIEVHHLEEVNGQPRVGLVNRPENLRALCPACHLRMHHPRTKELKA